MAFVDIVTLLGGVALFLFGMSVMGDSLKKVAGSKMEMILYKLSGNTFKGILLGTGVTAVIQSSSATSVMTVGFVNSGMMKIRQAIGVILGAILGTSITGWVLSINSIGNGSNIAAYFNTEILTGVVALIGIILRMFSKKTYLKNIGGILLGFAVLMYGMTFMSGAVEPLFGALTLLAFGHFVLAMPYLLSFAAGAMIYVVVEELIPEMCVEKKSDGIFCFALGFALMMALDVALG